MDMDPSATTGFISSITSPDMACGIGGAALVNRTCVARAGDSLSLVHRAWADGTHPDVGAIDPSHLGSVAVYMKKMAESGAEDPWASEAAGDGWFKVFWDGFSDGMWGTQKMIADGGLVDASVPRDIEGGYYLVRSEVLALQSVVDGDPARVDPQFYVGCAQVYVEGGGSATPSETVSIPGYVDESTPALGYNIYQQFPPTDPFEEFGPAVYGPGGAGSGSAGTGTAGVNTLSASSASDVSAVGSCPSTTVLEVANMCLTELPAWSDDTPGYLTKCWAASQSCWDKLTECWDNVSPAVNVHDQNQGCNLWNEKCLSLVDWCNEGNLEGPPGAGQVLTPAKGTLARRGAGVRVAKMRQRRTVEARGVTARNVGVLANGV